MAALAGRRGQGSMRLILQEVGDHLPLPLDGDGAPAGERVPLRFQDVRNLLGHLGARKHQLLSVKST
jgi:hypothetical protein